jgi:ribonuclease HI
LEDWCLRGLAETMACVKAVQAAESHGMANIEVETDSSLLKEALHSSERGLEPSVMLFKYLRDFLRDCFRNFRVSNSNVPRFRLRTRL